MHLVYQTFRTILVFVLVFAATDSLWAGNSAKDLVRHSNGLLRGNSSHSRMTMKIRTYRWRRTLEIESWNDGTDRVLLWIHKPVKEKNNKTLKDGDRVWNWLSAPEYLLKIPSTMMDASWMDSDFSFNDMFKSDKIVKNYNHTITSEKKEGDRTVFTIESIPKPDAETAWSRVLLTVSQDKEGHVIPVREVDYSGQNEKIRTIRYSKVKELGGDQIPTVLECIPHRREGRKTTITITSFEEDVSFDSDLFDLSNLQKGD